MTFLAIVGDTVRLVADVWLPSRALVPKGAEGRVVSVSGDALGVEIGGQVVPVPKTASRLALTRCKGPHGASCRGCSEYKRQQVRASRIGKADTRVPAELLAQLLITASPEGAEMARRSLGEGVLVGLDSRLTKESRLPQ